jgi:hypothetical protein
MAALKFSDLDGGHLGGGEVDLRTRPVRGWPLRHWSRGELLRRAGVDSPFVEDRRVENLALPEQMSVNVCQSGLVSSVTPPGLDHRDNPIDDLPGLAPFEEVEVSSIDQ